ncbi:hypothetical protein LINPERPRIM_LOCUS45275 [Linum perenne]
MSRGPPPPHKISKPTRWTAELQVPRHRNGIL